MRESRRRSVRDGLAVALALVLHVSALAFVARVGKPEFAVARTTTPPNGDEIAVELGDVPLEPSPSRAEAPRAVSASGAAASPSPAAVHHSSREAVAELAPSAELNSAASPLPAAPAVVAAPEASAARAINLGLGSEAWTRWLPPSGQGPTAPPLPRSPREPIVRAPPASSTGGLLEGLEAADKGRIVGPSGRVVSALEQAAHGEGATAFGVASFAVTVLRSGAVEVTLQSASAGDAEWQRVAQRAARDLAKNAPKIPPPRTGARFVVDLVADMTLPDGRRTQDLHGPRVEADAPRLHAWSAGKKDMLERNPTAASGLSLSDPDLRANVRLPGVYVAQNGKVCNYKFGLSVLGPLLQGGCDFENVGAKPQRVVHAQVRKQELF